MRRIWEESVNQRESVCSLARGSSWKLVEARGSSSSNFVELRGTSWNFVGTSPFCAMLPAGLVVANSSVTRQLLSPFSLCFFCAAANSCQNSSKSLKLTSWRSKFVQKPSWKSENLRRQALVALLLIFFSGIWCFPPWNTKSAPRNVFLAFFCLKFDVFHPRKL